MQTVSIGPLSITLDDTGSLELRTASESDRSVLSAQEGIDLLQWLYEQRDTLIAGSHQDQSSSE